MLLEDAISSLQTTQERATTEKQKDMLENILNDLDELLGEFEDET